jgi:ABC-type polysaccharide/polyol phosphate export permease
MTSITAGRHRFFGELVEGLRLWRVWTHLALHSLRLDYKDSRLGPLWIAIGLGVLIGAQGFLFSYLMRADMRTFYVWLASGLITWLLMLSIINASVTIFRANHAQMLNINLPYSFYVYRTLTAAFINFVHQAPIFIIVSLITYGKIFASAPLGLLGVLLILINGVWVGFFLGMAAVRFKGLAHLVPTVLTAMFLFTPVVWMPESLGDRAWLADLNPFTHYIALVRDPLMGQMPPLLSIEVVVVLTAIGCAAAHLIYRQMRATVILSV